MPRIEVAACKECPFFRQTLGAMLAGFLTRNRQLPVGECDCPDRSEVRHWKVGEVGPEADRLRDEALRRQRMRLKIFDLEKAPNECPLRGGDIIVGIPHVN